MCSFHATRSKRQTRLNGGKKSGFWGLTTHAHILLIIDYENNIIQCQSVFVYSKYVDIHIP